MVLGCWLEVGVAGVAVLARRRPLVASALQPLAGSDAQHLLQLLRHAAGGNALSNGAPNDKAPTLRVQRRRLSALRSTVTARWLSLQSAKFPLLQTTPSRQLREMLTMACNLFPQQAGPEPEQELHPMAIW
jgi:hypothetical protein